MIPVWNIYMCDQSRAFIWAAWPHDALDVVAHARNGVPETMTGLMNAVPGALGSRRNDGPINGRSTEEHACAATKSETPECIAGNASDGCACSPRYLLIDRASSICFSSV